MGMSRLTPLRKFIDQFDIVPDLGSRRRACDRNLAAIICRSKPIDTTPKVNRPMTANTAPTRPIMTLLSMKE